MGLGEYLPLQSLHGGQHQRKGSREGALGEQSIPEDTTMNGQKAELTVDVPSACDKHP